MQIVTNNVLFKARVMVMPQGITNYAKQTLPESVKSSNKHTKQSLLSKLMTCIIKPHLKTVLKDPS